METWWLVSWRGWKEKIQHEGYCVKVGKQMEAVNALSNEERREGHQCTGDDIVYECNKDILIDNVYDDVVTIAEAVLIPLTTAFLDTTRVVTVFWITFHQPLYS